MINTTLFDVIAATPELKSVGNLTVTNTFQTLTPGLLKAAIAAGGDAIDLYDPNGNGISGEYTFAVPDILVSYPSLLTRPEAALYGAAWSNAKDDAVVNMFIQKAIETLDARSKAAGLYYDFIYLNDAAPFQKNQTLPKYGGGKSLPRMKAIAHRYGKFLSPHVCCSKQHSKGQLKRCRTDPEAVFQKLLPGGFKLGA